MKYAVSCFRVPVVVLVGGLLLGLSQPASAKSGTATVLYSTTHGAIDGYETASVDVRYNLLNCAGEITIAVERVKGSVRVSPAYWYKGTRVPATAPPPSSPLVRFQGDVMHGARVIGQFRMQAGDALGFSCFTGDTQTIAKLSNYVGPKATQEERDRFIAGLTINVRRTDQPLENGAIGRAVEAEQRKAKAAAETAEREKRKAAEAAAAAVRKKKEEAEREQRRQEQARKQQETQQRQQTTSSTGSQGQGRPNGDNSGAGRPDPAGMAVDYARSKDGRFYRKDGNGKYHEVSAQEYNLGHARVQEERKSAAEAEHNRQVHEQARERRENQRRQQIEAERLNQRIDRQMNRLSQSFYAAEAVDQINSNISQISRLGGNYASAGELEADFQQRIAALENEMNNLAAAQESSFRAQTDLHFADTEYQAVGDAMNQIAVMMANSRRQEQEQEARQQLERQRARLRAEIEAKERAMQLEMRRNLLAQFPEGNVPLSHHKVAVDTLYFFSYTFDASTIEHSNPVITLANTFPIKRFGNGSWPFKHVINREIRKIVAGENALIGYYTSKELADSMRNSFVRLAQQSGFQIRDMNYAGRAPKGTSTRTAATKVDFWSTQPSGDAAQKAPADADKATPKPANKAVDFWK